LPCTKNGKTYDVIIDAVGKHSFRRCRRSLKRGGTYLETDLGFMWHVPLLALLTRWIGTKKVTLGITKCRGGRPLPQGACRGRDVSSDRSYPLEDVVEATRGTWRRSRRLETSSSPSTAGDLDEGVVRDRFRPDS
jgi:NADPH:quinone reductase-like Zn-dependent oxidoreductase